MRDESTYKKGKKSHLGVKYGTIGGRFECTARNESRCGQSTKRSSRVRLIGWSENNK
jgi:hypothetical protein